VILSAAVVYLIATGKPLGAGEIAVFYIPLLIVLLLLSPKQM
jgi:hypothetical protein